MTKKTYQQLADDIGRVLAEQGNGNTESWQIIDAMCSAMKYDNPRFDRQTFVDAIEKARASYIKKWDDRTLQALTNSIVNGNG